MRRERQEEPAKPLRVPLARVRVRLATPSAVAETAPAR